MHIAGNVIGRRRGGMLIYMLVVMTGIIGLASLAVDYGRVQMAKSELQAAADAASRAAASGMGNGYTEAQNRASQIAASNKCDGQSISVDTNADIEFLSFNETTGASTVLTGSARNGANAVRVTLRRTAARGNPIPLLFAKVVGANTCDLTARSTALLDVLNGGPFVGLSLARMFNTAKIDSYNSSTGPYNPATAGSKGLIYSNTDLWLYDSAIVKGDARYGPSGKLNRDPTTVVTGSLQKLAAAPYYPPVSIGTYSTSNDNSLITQYRSGTSFSMGKDKGTVTFPGGNFYFSKFEIGLNSTVYFSGTTTIWLNGDAKIEGTVAHTSLRPYQLTVNVGGGHKVQIEGPGARFYGHLYNPQGDVHHHQGGQSFGYVISDLLCFRQTSQGHSDEASGSGGNIRVVR